ncbi:MAG: PEP-CTERM sorting domain-containing protein [Nitrosomonas sp.]|nr:PEP-CTERM sorting domain-containing protein [Nitrosomonas sp.]
MLNISGGCFSYGAAGATGCGNTDTSRKEYAKGSYTLTNTIPGAPSTYSTYSYDASAALNAINPTNNTSFSSNQSKYFATNTALAADPVFGPAFAFVNTIPTQLGTEFTLPLNTISWKFNSDNTFEAWSGSDLQPLSQFLLGSKLPLSPVTFNLNIRFDAVPEPTTLALIGLGILGISVAQKRKTTAALTAC